MNLLIKNQKALTDSYKFKPKPKRETTLERKLREKKETQAEDELLAKQGQESETKAKEYVSYEVKEFDKARLKEKSNEYDWLTGQRRRKDEDYLVALGSILHHKLKTVDWPIGFTHRVVVEGRNILSEFYDNYGRRFTKGFKASGEVDYDYRGIKVLTEEAENTIEEIERGSLKKTRSGIILP